MKKVLILSVMLVLVFSLPTLAAYQVNWAENFDWINGDSPDGVNLTGQHGWTTATTASGKVMRPPVEQLVPRPLSETHYYKQSKAGLSVAGANNAKDMRPGALAFKRGRMDAWLYDYNLGIANQTDTRIGVHSTVGNTSIGYMATVNVTDVGAGNVNFWRAQWSWTALNLDGTNANSTGTGWAFSNPNAVPRVTGWNYVRIEFGYTYPAGTNTPTDLWVKWFINKNPISEISLAGYDLMLTVNDTAGSRWTNMGSGIAGMFLGSTYACGVNSAPIDNVIFKGNVVPEPTSLLALGTGLVGLMGLIRRKR